MEQAGRADDLTPEQKCFRIAQPQSTADHSRACVNAWTESLPSSYICDMSVMPFSSAANPVRTLAALALRLSRHFG